jgi:hypothetical protein
MRGSLMRGSVTRRLVVLVAAVAVALGAAAPAHASGAVERHRYVANDFASFVLAGLSQSSGFAMDGTVTFKPAHDSVVVTLADHVAKGTIPLVIDTTDGRRVQCVPAGYPARVRDLVPGEWVAFTLLDYTYHASNCTTGATEGILTLQL